MQVGMLLKMHLDIQFELIFGMQFDMQVEGHLAMQFCMPSESSESSWGHTQIVYICANNAIASLHHAAHYLMLQAKTNITSHIKCQCSEHRHEQYGGTGALHTLHANTPCFCCLFPVQQARGDK